MRKVARLMARPLISGKYVFSNRDVLYSKIRPYLRKAALPNFKGICSADMYPVRPRDEVLLRDFLYFILLHERFTFQANSFQSRTGIPKINRTQLGMTLLPVPSVNEQEQITHILHSVEQKIEVEEKRTQSLEVLFKTLLHNLMTGKVRVNDLDLLEVDGVV
jgi:type I restriction enzyme S subunit